jgi:hypothetical protein
MATQRNTGGGGARVREVGVKAGSRQRNLTGPANATQPGGDRISKQSATDPKPWPCVRPWPWE